MTKQTQIILSQLRPPAARGNIFPRERVSELLAASLGYPLTILIAETGYGKTTSLICFIEKLRIPVFWYSASRAERDPILFLRHLFTAFNQHGFNFGQEALRLLQNSDSAGQESLITLINALQMRANQEFLFILDDFQSLSHSVEILELMNWLIEHLPRNLHLVISSRIPFNLPSLNHWRVKGLILELSKEDLTFSEEEVADLFKKTYQLDLDEAEVAQLRQQTEGWAIGLQVVWQSLRNKPKGRLSELLEGDTASGLSELPPSSDLADPQTPLTSLFEYLAEEILDKQDELHRNFLIRTSILSFLESDICDFLLDRNDSLDLINDLYRAGLFVDQLQPGIYRYHHIFRRFLHSRVRKTPGLWYELHRKTASYFAAHHYWERAISHLLSAGEYTQVEHVLNEVGDRMVREGLYQSLRYWISQMPEDLRSQYPYGNYLMGEVERYEGHFEMALEYYRTAQRLYQVKNNAWGLSLALRGQAQVYLDTIRPINATQLLNRSLDLLDPQEYPGEVASLLVQIAENQVNQGDTIRAEENLKRSRALAQTEQVERDYIRSRLYLRTGRLTEGIQLLESLEPAAEDLKTNRPQRFHREASLLLSLFYALLGDGEKAAAYARKGQSLANLLKSKFVRSVGSMRLGHALQLLPAQALKPDKLEQVHDCYQEAIREIDVVRIHVEPLWGMVRLLGYSGQLEEALRVEQDALAIAQNAGDEWICMLIHISMGASLAIAGQHETASQELSLAESIALQVEDSFGQSAALLWLAYNADLWGYQNSSIVFLEQALHIIHEKNYSFLLTKASLLGPDDPTLFIPLLLKAQKNYLQPELVNQVFAEHKLGSITYHPGYSLKISCLGGFEVWRGHQLIPADAWKREKARQLLQILALNRHKGVSKDQLGVMLWPEADSATVNNNLKVALSTLNQVLEPQRPAGESAFYVQRGQDQFMLNPDAPILLDYELFEEMLSNPDLQVKEEALDLYRGNLLEGEVGQEWFMYETHYYQRIYIENSLNVLQDTFKKAEFSKCLGMIDRLLQIDPQLEAAYLWQMRLYHAQGNLAMLRKVYHQAQETLRKTLSEDYSSLELSELYQNLLKS